MRVIVLFLIFGYLYLQANGHIFVYHRFGDERYPSANTTIKELKKEFDYFKKNNYKVVPLNAIISKLHQGEEIPDNWIALTIDDAYKSFYDNALEIFKQYDYPFTLFVYVKASHKKYGDYMTWEEIKEVLDYGEVGLHSYNHPHLTRLSKKKIYEDTKKAYELFSSQLQLKPKYYAYPYGEYNEQVKQTIKKFGFKAIFNQNSGSVNASVDPFDINRIALVGDVNIEHKLRYNTIAVDWIKPQQFPQDGVLDTVAAEVDPKLKSMKLYITGIGWQDVPVQNGRVDVSINKYLQNSRTRIILGIDHFNIANKVIIKPQKKEK